MASGLAEDGSPLDSEQASSQTAKWQARYGRDPTVTDQQRAWLVNNLKVPTDIAMRATKLNAQVQLTNLQAMY